MELQEFFEDSISLEFTELFEEFREEKAKKTALNFTRREMLENYAGEESETVIVYMTSYWCGLQNQIEDAKSKKFLESLTDEKMFELFGNEALKVLEVLDKLLGRQPKQREVKKVKKPTIRGSKKWKAGDLYAYKLKGRDAEIAGIAGKYAILYCRKVTTVSKNTNEIEMYMLLSFDKELPSDPKAVFDNAVFLPLSIFRYYIYLLISPHKEYPDDEIIYLGNLPEIPHPSNEAIPPSELHYGRIVWKMFDERFVGKFETWKKYGVDQEKYLK